MTHYVNTDCTSSGDEDEENDYKETFFMGCNPKVIEDGADGLSKTYSVSLTCTAGSELGPLTVIPLNGESYAVEQ